MTKEEILKMEAGPEIDALFAEKVMGFDVYKPGENYVIRKPNYIRNYVPDYSTNIGHAMEGVEKAIKEKMGFYLSYTGLWNCTLYTKGIATYCPEVECPGETAPLAITRALILWALQKGE